MGQKKFQIKEETRKRCKVVVLEEKDRKKFTPISMELFHFLFEAKTIAFSIFVRVDDELVEFVRPEELSNELLQQIAHAAHSDNSHVEICIRRVDYQAFEDLLRAIREQKTTKLLEKHPDLDRKVLEVFANLSSASQMIVRGGVTSEVAQRVKAVASFTVNNLLDSDVAIGTLSRMVIADPTLYDHSASVAMIASMIAARILPKPLTQRESEAIAQCALYHDVGKTCVPNNILNKPGKFTPEEYEIVKSHTTLGNGELLKCIEAGAPIQPIAARVALEHHEKFIGGGYPLGKKGRMEEDEGNGIHLYSRIVSIADVYSALLMKRIYKPAYEAQDALKIMVGCAKDYDPVLFKPFVKAVLESLNAAQEKNGKGRILEFDGTGGLREKATKGSA